MKITFIGHASILIETAGISILSDPWWRGPCFGAQWWNYPPADLSALEGRKLDYIYISHGHHDHFHPGSLRSMEHSAKVLTSRRTDLGGAIRELGFDVIELDDDDEFALGPRSKCRIVRTHSDDTLMTVSDENEVCLNLNDALHAAPRGVQIDFVRRLKAWYPKIDYVFCGYGVASHFPNCYVIPGKDRGSTAAERQRYFNRQWAWIISELAPRFAFPFAADVALLESDLFWSNEPVQNAQRPTQALRELYPAAVSATFDIAPGFCVESGSVNRMVLRQPLSAERLAIEFSDQIERANRYGRVDEPSVEEVKELLDHNVGQCRKFTLSYAGNYNFLIRFRGSPLGIRICKEGSTIEVEKVVASDLDPATFDLIYTTRVAYLKRSLSEPYGDEILFVGSGGIFEYLDRNKATLNLHRELMPLLRLQSEPLDARQSLMPGWQSKVKGLLKSMVGRRDTDLYDLGAWTVFVQHGGQGD